VKQRHLLPRAFEEYLCTITCDVHPWNPKRSPFLTWNRRVGPLTLSMRLSVNRRLEWGYFVS